MSQVRLWSVVGDSNISRNVNKTSSRANPLVKAAQFISCGHLGIFSESIKKVRSESSVCIVSCLTNFVCNAEESTSASASGRAEGVFREILQVLQEACTASPDRYYMVAPPMYRTSPTWYREGLPAILTSFSMVMSPSPPT